MGAFISPFPAVSKSQVVNGLTEYFVVSPFAVVTPSTVGNTVAETSLLSVTNALGSKTIPANYLQVGSQLVCRIVGSIGTDAVQPSITIKAYYGSTVISTAVVTPAAQIAAGTYFELWVTTTVTAIGASGSFTTAQVTWLANSSVSGPVTVPTVQAVDTTAAGAYDVKITWGTAAALNTVTASTGVLEVIG